MADMKKVYDDLIIINLYNCNYTFTRGQKFEITYWKNPHISLL